MMIGLGTFVYDGRELGVVLSDTTSSGVDGWLNCLVIDDEAGDRLFQNCKRSSAMTNIGTLILQEQTQAGIINIDWPDNWRYQVEAL